MIALVPCHSGRWWEILFSVRRIQKSIICNQVFRICLTAPWYVISNLYLHRVVRLPLKPPSHFTEYFSIVHDRDNWAMANNLKPNDMEINRVYRKQIGIIRKMSLNNHKTIEYIRKRIWNVTQCSDHHSHSIVKNNWFSYGVLPTFTANVFAFQERKGQHEYEYQ